VHDLLIYNENKITPRIIIETLKEQHKNLKFTIREENNNQTALIKSGSNTLIHWLNKGCRVWRQNITLTFSSISEMCGEYPGSLTRRRRILKGMFFLSQ
jgi:hypothetical protein